MSYIIDQRDNFLFNSAELHHRNSRFFTYKQPQSRNNLIDIKENITKQLGCISSSLLHLTQQLQAITIRIYMHKVYRQASAILTIKLNVFTQQIGFSLKMLTLENKLMLVEGKERRQLIYKMLCNRNFQYLFNTLKVSIHFHSGQIKIDSYSQYCHDINQALSKIALPFINILSRQLRLLQEPLNNIIEMSNQNQKGYAEDIVTRRSDKRMMKLYNYCRMMNVALNLGSQTTNQQKLLNDYLKRESDCLDLLKRNYQPINSNFSSLFLFNQQNQNIFSPYSHFEIDYMEREYIENKIQLPYMQRAKNPHQNCFVLNYIVVNKKLSETVVRKINSGGFTSIYLSEIEYWYVGSYCLGIVAQPQKDTPPHKKYIIIKREEKGTSKNGKSRIAHQRFILTKIKNGVSMFLPKYYLLAEKDNSYQNDLLVDYIPHPNLSEYITKNKQTLSLHTKLYLVVMITQGLRYIQQYKIAHLDLKPTNIMMNNRLTIKLIDFGQSYHPDIKYPHQPGFSMPYSAPQNYNFPQNYSYKNDVFSIGIILNELLFNSYPLYIYSDRLKEQIFRKTGQFCKFWLFCPEGNQMRGQHIIFPVLQMLIGKCMHPDPNLRPELQWIVLVLRQCLECFC